MGAVAGKDDKDHILVLKVVQGTSQVSTAVPGKVTKGASLPPEETAQNGKVQETGRRIHQEHVLCTICQPTAVGTISAFSSIC